MLETIIGLALGGLIGYLFGLGKAFREEKHKAYRELLPPIIRFAFRRQTNEVEFNESLIKIWLYANKNVAIKLRRAVSIARNPGRGDLIVALQEAIAAMRKDIQLLPFWQTIEPEDITHFQTILLAGGEDQQTQ